jgi:WD40 repeat protein
MSSSERETVADGRSAADTVEADTFRDDGADKTVESPVEPDSKPLPLRSLEDLPVVGPERYLNSREFARGGIGRISRAHDRQLDRDVALKELRRLTRYGSMRFAREVRITAKLQHPSIVPLHDAGRWPSGEPFFAMKLVGGGSLEDAIDSCTTLRDHLRLLRHMIDVCEAIAYAHGQQVVHRDLKPANVLVGPFGETVVIDWGLAKDLAAPDEIDLPDPASEDREPHAYQTTDGVVLGTPPYMPPEQAVGELVDERADVYALGAMLYHVLAGKPPYANVKPRNVLQAVAGGPPKPLDEVVPDLPRDLVAIVAKAMARHPDHRYATAGDMAKELIRFNTGGLVAAYSYSSAELLRRFLRRQRNAVFTAAGGLVVLLVVGVWSVVNITAQRNRAEEQRQRAEQSAAAERTARRDAELRRDQAVLEGARAAAQQDPTFALGLLKRLPKAVPGAASVAADAFERGVARQVLAGHEDRVEAIAFAADGKLLASASRDKTVRLWQLADGKARVLHGHRDRVPALAFLGNVLVTAGYDQRVGMAAPGADKLRLLEGHGGAVKALAIDPSGKRFASVADDGVRLWSAAGKQLRRFEAPADRPLFAAFSPDGRMLLSGSHDSTLRLWALDDGTDRTLSGHRREVKRAVFDPKGRWVASASEDATVRLWSLRGGAPRVLEGHRGGVECLATSHDGQRLVSGGQDGQVLSWDVESGAARVIARHRERVAAVAVSPDDRWVASGSWDRSVLLLDRQSGSLRRLQGHRDVVSALAFSPDGKWLASGSWDREPRVWAVESAGRRVLQAHDVGAKTVAFSPDGKRVASGGHDDVVRIWNATDGTLERELRGHRDHVFRVVFSPDGRFVASSSDDTTVRLWPVDGGEARVFEGHRADVEELAFSADGRLLASAGEDGAVGLWRLAPDAKAPAAPLLRGQKAAVTGVAFSPDGAALASSSRDGSVRLWSTATGKQLHNLEGHDGEVTSVVFAHGGDRLATAGHDDSVRLWKLEDQTSRVVARDLAGAERVAFSPDDAWLAVWGAGAKAWLCPVTGNGCRVLLGHGTRIHALEFAPDGAHLVTSSGDGTLRVWDTASGESHPLRGHTAPVFDLALSRDGQRVASASGDRSVRLWRLALPPRDADLGPWLDNATRFVIDGAAPRE